jgi:hypothetical protein
MPRKPRKLLKTRQAAIPAALQKYFEGEKYGPEDEGACEVFLMELRPKMKEAWISYRDQIIAGWIKRKPCSRPFAFWEFDVTEIRRRVGGTGDLFNDLEDYGPHECHLGIPGAWVTAWQVDYYNGRSRDIHGKIISSIFKDGDFTRVAVDPKNPPVFESEAVYLQRLNFLTPMERKYLVSHPELLEPEVVEIDEEEDD